MSDLSDNPTRTYRRKVYAIKKSVYVNIPSKISREIGVAKGAILYVTLQGNRVVLSKYGGEPEPVAKTKPLVVCALPQDNASGSENSRNNILDKLSDW